MHFYHKIEFCAQNRCCSIVSMWKQILIRVIYWLLLHKLNSSLSAPCRSCRNNKKCSLGLHCEFLKYFNRIQPGERYRIFQRVKYAKRGLKIKLKYFSSCSHRRVDNSLIGQLKKMLLAQRHKLINLKQKIVSRKRQSHSFIDTFMDNSKH